VVIHLSSYVVASRTRLGSGRRPGRMRCEHCDAYRFVFEMPDGRTAFHGRRFRFLSHCARPEPRVSIRDSGWMALEHGPLISVLDLHRDRWMNGNEITRIPYGQEVSLSPP
jgi:hypothetical protein